MSVAEPGDEQCYEMFLNIKGDEQSIRYLLNLIENDKNLQIINPESIKKYKTRLL